MMGFLDSHGGDGWDLLTPDQQNDILEAEEKPSRDERWERVSATVRDYIWPYEDEKVVPTYPVVEFLIEVRYNDKVWYSRILVAEEDLKRYPESYNHTLDKMVETIDDYMRYS